MQHPHGPDAVRPGYTQPRRRTGLIALAVIGFVVLAGALHLIGVLPPGS